MTRISNDEAMRHLSYVGRSWYASVRVPQELVHIVGKSRLKASLGTGDLETAKRIKLKVVAQMQATIASARQRLANKEEREAVEMRGAGVPQEVIEERAEQIAARFGDGKAKAFASVSLGQGTPIDMHMETWLGQNPYREKTRGAHRSIVREFIEWASNIGVATCEEVRGKVAVQYRDVHLVNMNRVTANRHMSALRTYWRWMIRSSYLDEDLKNPWDDKCFKVRGDGNPDDAERPFEDWEVEALLNADRDVCDDHDLAVCRVAALSGMRAEEIFQLKWKHVDWVNWFFDLRTLPLVKRKASRRIVPVHQKLKGIISDLASGKNDQESYIFAKDNAIGKDGARSILFSKRFFHIRHRLGIDDMSGQGGARRRSRVNFHSFRRWFATQCEKAGHQETDTARVIGHAIQGVTYGTYSGGQSLQRLRDVVNSVDTEGGLRWASR